MGDAAQITPYRSLTGPCDSPALEEFSPWLEQATPARTGLSLTASWPIVPRTSPPPGGRSPLARCRDVRLLYRGFRLFCRR
jgi:hypothetical protein